MISQQKKKQKTCFVQNIKEIYLQEENQLILTEHMNS